MHGEGALKAIVHVGDHFVQLGHILSDLLCARFFLRLLGNYRTILRVPSYCPCATASFIDIVTAVLTLDGLAFL